MEQRSVTKSAESERRRIERLVSRESARIRRYFRAFIARFSTADVRRQIRIALERGGIEAALAIVHDYVYEMRHVIQEVFEAAGITEVGALKQQIAVPGFALTFDPGNPRAEAIMRRAQLDFIREFSEVQLASTRAALVDAMRVGAGPREVARALQDSIGLTEYQRNNVRRYRELLERNDYLAATARDLRDRRSDRLLNRLADDAHFLADREPLGDVRINRMVSRYRDNYVRYRAETIARTEAHIVVNQARSEALDQVVDQANIPADAVSRRWVSTLDDRVRDTHRDMNGQKRGFKEPFVSPRGAKMMQPGDRSLGAPGSEIINCRCTLAIDIAVD